MELNVHEFFYSSLGSIYVMMIQDIVGNGIDINSVSYMTQLKKLLKDYSSKMSFEINIPYTIYYHPLAIEHFQDLPKPTVKDVNYDDTNGSLTISKEDKKFTHNLINNIKKLEGNVIKAAIVSPKLLNNLVRDTINDEETDETKKEIAKVDVSTQNTAINKFVGIVNNYDGNDVKSSDQVLEDAFKSMRKFIIGQQNKITTGNINTKYDYVINEHLLFNSFLLQLSKSSEILIKDENVFIPTLDVNTGKIYKDNNVVDMWDTLILCIKAMTPTSDTVTLTPQLIESRKKVVTDNLNIPNRPEKFNDLLNAIRANVIKYFAFK